MRMFLIVFAASVEFYAASLMASEYHPEDNKPVQVSRCIVLEEGEFQGNRKMLITPSIVNPNSFPRPIDRLTVYVQPPLELVVDRDRISLDSFRGSLEGGEFWQGRLHVLRKSTVQLDFRIFAVFPNERATCTVVLKSSRIMTKMVDTVEIDAPVRFVGDLGNWFSWKDDLFATGWSLSSSGGPLWKWIPTREGALMGGEDWLSVGKNLGGLKISECTYMLVRYRTLSGQGRLSVFLVWNDILGTPARTAIYWGSSSEWTTATLDFERFAHSSSTLARIELMTESSVVVEIEYILFFGR